MFMLARETEIPPQVQQESIIEKVERLEQELETTKKAVDDMILGGGL